MKLIENIARDLCVHDNCTPDFEVDGRPLWKRYRGEAEAKIPPHWAAHLRRVSDARSRDNMGVRDSILDEIADWIDL